MKILPLVSSWEEDMPPQIVRRVSSFAQSGRKANISIEKSEKIASASAAVKTSRKDFRLFFPRKLTPCLSYSVRFCSVRTSFPRIKQGFFGTHFNANSIFQEKRRKKTALNLKKIEIIILLRNSKGKLIGLDIFLPFPSLFSSFVLGRPCIWASSKRKVAKTKIIPEVSSSPSYGGKENE